MTPRLTYPSWGELTAFRSRVRGCLLGGAIGDALGYPIEFLTLSAIRAAYGAGGITDLVPDQEGVTGRITDDTQMTLFTVEAVSAAYRREQAKGIGGAATMMVRDAYLRWLDTQEHPVPPPADGVRHRSWSGLRDEAWLYARRAPGNACLSGLRENYAPTHWSPLDGSAGPVNPASKGCGTVMRSAPFGLTGSGAQRSFELAARCAQITHGHPTGYYAAGALAAMVSCLTEGDTLEGAAMRTLWLLARYPGHEETTAALRKAADLAAEGGATPEKVESLGAGWIAEEALAIALYAALTQKSVKDALLLSVNHSGDSDSTGAICGNLLGARHGDVRLPKDWVPRIEGRGLIAALADDLAAEVNPADARRWEDH
ncbi:ADP-ribosylglycohydrolase [Kitasatospora sp. GP30]|uniref:ADP-ribosylglycohydrolase family protein n=1 Tax=Kitasatospora sp. GP30 TaxID=3035084 RepID=UPI000CC28EE5|nr:ADP-ribosylglycohydrolase family protein [Kitasatospora sp. GP30]MDH6145644.1 ADP-ribosylglycohydrolase [Kitasatospora sp. GP30]